jgi:succinate dehydrogenase/fumarate reductase flavoprotein subunit
MKSGYSVFDSDVLVIGSGIAGCFASIRAKELGADVVMVEQGKSGYWGMSVGGTHRVRVVLPGRDDLDAAMRGTVRECEYMVDQEFIEGALAETWDRFQDMQSLGGEFRRDEHGDVKWYWSDTAYPDFKQRNAMWEPVGSYKHILKMNSQAVKRGVRVLDRVMLIDLITDGKRVHGAVGFDTRQGNFCVFRARAVVVAAGGFSGGGVGNWPSLTGDGIAMGIRAGAELRGMEFGKAETGGMLPDRGAPPWVSVLLNPQDPEVTITNALGEEFLEQYELGRRMEGRKYYGPPWRVQLMAALKEIKEGRGPCYVDYRAPDKAARLREFWGSFFDRTLKQVKLMGTNFDQMKYELALARGYNLSGGIRIDPRGQSTVQGLYSAGQSSDMCCIAQYAIVSGMMASAITARRAGESAAAYAFGGTAPRVDKEQVEFLKERVYGPLGRKDGPTADGVRMETIRAWVNIDIRSDERLEAAQRDFERLREQADGLVAPDYHELVKCHKIKSYIDCSEAVAHAARARRETRLEHIREDYPLTDNKGRLNWVIVRQVDGRLSARLEEIPLERWKYRPEPEVVDRLRPAGGKRP